MLSWVVKVVPQPPEPPSKEDEEQKEKPAAPPPLQEKKVTFQDEGKKEAPKIPGAPGADKQEAQTAEGNSAASVPQPGVLTWISGAMPQPPVQTTLSQTTPPSASTCPTEETVIVSRPEDERGMLAWIAQGLEKVVPQPYLKVKESAAAERPVEVRPAAAAAAEINVIQVQQETDTTDNRPLPPRMMDWIKQGIDKVVPQREIHVQNEKTDAPASTKAKAPPPEPPPALKPAADTEKSSGEAEQQQPNMMGRIFSGIGRMMPQPVQKQDSACGDVQSRGKGGESPLK